MSDQQMSDQSDLFTDPAQARAQARARDLAAECEPMGPVTVFAADGTTVRVNKEDTRRAPPDPFVISQMEDPQFLITGVQWQAMAIAVRVEAMLEIGLSAAGASESDVFAVLPEQTLAWLTGWQQLVNSGACWLTAGSVGRTANALIEAGYLLAAPEPTYDWVGEMQRRAGRNDVPALATRDQLTPGAHGSPVFVRAIMGPRYLAWLEAIV